MRSTYNKSVYYLLQASLTNTKYYKAIWSNLPFKKEIPTLLWAILDEKKLVIWCLFYGIRNIQHSTEWSADGINFSWCGSLNNVGYSQWQVQDCRRIPHHCCGILQQSCNRHWGEPTSSKLPHQLKLIPSALHSVLCCIFLIP